MPSCSRSPSACSPPAASTGRRPPRRQTRSSARCRRHPQRGGDLPALALTGDAAAGKALFTTSCGGCHTLADAGTSGNVGPNLDESKPSTELVVTNVTNGKGTMPPFGDSLEAQQIADIAAYVTQSTGG